jgi:hypothetical protein
MVHFYHMITLEGAIHNVTGAGLPYRTIIAKKKKVSLKQISSQAGHSKPNMVLVPRVIFGLFQNMMRRYAVE